MINKSVFGKTSSGEVIHLYELSNDQIKVEIIELGCIVRSLMVLVDKDWREVCLGFSTLEEYLSDPYYTGAVVGRVANRIANGKARIDNNLYELSLNASPHHLHGGVRGWNRRKWIGEISTNSIFLSLTDESGEEGYPGELNAGVEYSLSDNGLEIKFTARTSQTTMWNPTFHGYFNLGRETNILNHKLQVNSDQIIETNQELIPTGMIVSADQKGLNLSNPNSIGEIIEKNSFLDTSFICDHTTNEVVASLLSDDLMMEVSTDAFTIHIYDGAGLLPEPYAGICLETQGYTDAPNHREFPPIEIYPGKKYETSTTFRFIGR